MSGQDRLDAPRVLVVEDNDVIRELVVSQLTGVGFEVVDTGTMTDAIRMAETIGAGALDVVVSDMRLPDGSGDQVVEQIRLIHPATKAILVSGAFGPGSGHRSVPGVVYLEKPFRRQELLEAVGGLLDEERIGGAGHVGG